MDKQEQQDCQHEGFKENELWELKGGKHDGYEPWELEYGRDKIGVGECGPEGPEFKEQEYLEPKNIKNQPQGLRFDLGSKTQGRYAHPTSHMFIATFNGDETDEYATDYLNPTPLHPPTPKDKLNRFNHLTAYPNPTSPFIYDNLNTLQHDYGNGVPGAIAYWPAPQIYTDKYPMEEEEPFIYDDIDTLHCDYEDGILEAIEYMRAMNQVSDECMADDEDYQSYCQEIEERRCHSPTPPLSTPHVKHGAPQTPQAPGTGPMESTAPPTDPLDPLELALGQVLELPLLS